MQLSKESSRQQGERSWMVQPAHIIPEPQGRSLSSQAPGGPPPCMNDCIAWPTPGPPSPHGPRRAPCAWEQCGVQTGEAGGFHRQWGAFLHLSSVELRQVECGDGAVSGRVPRTSHTISIATICTKFPICILACVSSAYCTHSAQYWS